MVYVISSDGQPLMPTTRHGKANQAPRYVHGYQLFDKVKYNGQECFIFGRRSSGSFDIRLLDGTKISQSISYKKLKPLEKRRSYITERRITIYDYHGKRTG